MSLILKTKRLTFTVKFELESLLEWLVRACKDGDMEAVAEAAAIRELNVNRGPKPGYDLCKERVTSFDVFGCLSYSSVEVMRSPLAASICHLRPAMVEALLRLRPDLAMDDDTFFEAINFQELDSEG